MNRFIYFLISIFVFSVAFGCSKDVIPPVKSNKMNGVSWVASNRVITETNVQPLNELSANYSALIPFAFMYNLQSNNVIFNTANQWWGESEEGIRTTAQLMKKKGIKRLIKPQIWVLGGKFVGEIEMNSEENWTLFEKSYREYILFYAKIAQEEGIEAFCIGTELKKFVVQRPQFWKQLIIDVRKVYFGELTYATNWDHITKPTFWDDLDFIGIDAYFPLSEEKEVSKENLKQAWQPIVSDLEELSQKWNRPIVFTEFGYRNVEFTCKEPWTSDSSLKLNHQNQKEALGALFETFWDKPWFKGGFLWKWHDFSSDINGESDTKFTVQNKPAEQLVREWYLKYKN
jgi:hypothetical protein